MASIERTAYPRFKPTPTTQELLDLYTPTPEELTFAQSLTRSPTQLLTLLVLRKAFQRLGYFPRLMEVPEAIVPHMRGCLRLGGGVALGYEAPRLLDRHYRAIRTYLQVLAYGREARHQVIHAVYAAAQRMDNPADLINVALETLIKERYELPAFSTVDRLVRRVRTLVNQRFFSAVFQRLSTADQARLDALLIPDPRLHRSLYNRLKQVPKRPTLTHLQE